MKTVCQMLTEAEAMKNQKKIIAKTQGEGMFK